ncbi:hypothetical protein RFI_37361, partial [Reticulomyxa filosa]
NVEKLKIKKNGNLKKMEKKEKKKEKNKREKGKRESAMIVYLRKFTNLDFGADMRNRLKQICPTMRKKKRMEYIIKSLGNAGAKLSLIRTQSAIMEHLDKFSQMNQGKFDFCETDESKLTKKKKSDSDTRKVEKMARNDCMKKLKSVNKRVEIVRKYLLTDIEKTTTLGECSIWQTRRWTYEKVEAEEKKSGRCQKNNSVEIKKTAKSVESFHMKVSNSVDELRETHVKTRRSKKI